MSREYERVLRGLIHDYCELKRNSPFEEFPNLAAAIWRYSVLVEVYASLCGKLRKNYLEG
jgi:hypothetical protein